MLAVMAVGALLVVWAFWSNRQSKQVQGARGRTNKVFFLFFLAILAGVLIASRTSFSPGERRQPEPPAVQVEGERAPAEEREEATDPYRPRFRWLPALIAGGLLVGALVLVARAGGRVEPRRPETNDEELLEELEAMLDDTLDDLRAEPDPRAAVIAAYARTERALARFGLRREEAEGPMEYLARVAPVLRERRGSAHRLLVELTHLYERAKFSQHEIDLRMKEEAISTLETLRDELRAERA